MGNNRAREGGLLQDVRNQNSHLRQLIDITADLLARSQALLRRLQSRAATAATDTERPAQ